MKYLALLGLLVSTMASAMELQGFVTTNCEQQVGLIIHVDNDGVDLLGLNGRIKRLLRKDIENLLIYNVVENPIQPVQLNDESLHYLKSIYFDESEKSQTYAFPIQFIDDLLIFYSLDGKVHVRTFEDIYKIRPAPENLKNTQTNVVWKSLNFEFNEATTNCANTASKNKGGVKPTRILADKISIDEFLSSFEQGYSRLESFEERTYLYAKPFLYPKKSRLGIVFAGVREEPAPTLPIYFQWSTGEPYRFQSLTIVGMKSHEFLPNTQPVAAIRSEVKSHIFHAMFIGNIMGMSAGSAIFIGSPVLTINGSTSVQPSFNYMALMGGDYGAWSLSGGLYYPTFGIKVSNEYQDEYREILGSSASYAMRLMFTKEKYRLRVIGSYSNYNKGTVRKSDVLAVQGDPSNDNAADYPTNFSFNSIFLRGGVDYQITPRFSAGLDGIFLKGGYKETYKSIAGNVDFKKMTIQAYLQRAFGEYVSISGYVNFMQNTYDGSLSNIDAAKKQNEVLYFGALEFIL